MTRSRSDAAEAAAQVPGAAAVLLEALRYRGKSARQLGLPTQLWCADFMNMVLRKAGGKGSQSRAARSFLQFGKRLDGPRVGAIVVLYRKGPEQRPCRRRPRHRRPGQPDRRLRQPRQRRAPVDLSEGQGARLRDAARNTCSTTWPRPRARPPPWRSEDAPLR